MNYKLKITTKKVLNEGELNRYRGTLEESKVWYVYKIGRKYYFFYKSLQGGIRIYPSFKNFSQDQNEARIYGFYYILQHLDDVGYLELLYASVYYDEREDEHFDFYGYQDMGDFKIILDRDEKEIVASYNSYNLERIFPGQRVPGIRWDEKYQDYVEPYTYEEFNLLMQMYFGVYDDVRLVRELEEKEKRGELEGLKKIKFKDVLRMRDNENEESKKRLEEYLLFRLSKKSIEGAFEDIEKRKEYDRRRSEQEQEEVVKRLNKLLGGELEMVRMKE